LKVFAVNAPGNTNAAASAIARSERRIAISFGQLVRELKILPQRRTSVNES
jgi:hypothetical protein